MRSELEIVVTLPLAQADYVEIFPLGELERTFRFISLMLLAGRRRVGPAGPGIGLAYPAPSAAAAITP